MFRSLVAVSAFAFLATALPVRDARACAPAPHIQRVEMDAKVLDSGKDRVALKDIIIRDRVGHPREVTPVKTVARQDVGTLRAVKAR